jgi:hypothetical protein
MYIACNILTSLNSFARNMVRDMSVILEEEGEKHE